MMGSRSLRVTTGNQTGKESRQGMRKTTAEEATSRCLPWHWYPCVRKIPLERCADQVSRHRPTWLFISQLNERYVPDEFRTYWAKCWLSEKGGHEFVSVDFVDTTDDGETTLGKGLFILFEMSFIAHRYDGRERNKSMIDLLVWRTSTTYSRWTVLVIQWPHECVR